MDFCSFLSVLRLMRNKVLVTYIALRVLSATSARASVTCQVISGPKITFIERRPIQI